MSTEARQRVFWPPAGLLDSWSNSRNSRLSVSFLPSFCLPTLCIRRMLTGDITATPYKYTKLVEPPKYSDFHARFISDSLEPLLPTFRTEPRGPCVNTAILNPQCPLCRLALPPENPGQISGYWASLYRVRRADPVTESVERRTLYNR